LLARMKSSLLVFLAIFVYFGGGVAGDTEKDDEIGYCENLNSGDDFLTVNWLGAAGAVISVLGDAENVLPGQIGAVFNLLAQFGRSTNWKEYMEDLGQCVKAMIQEAIEKENLDDCESYLNLIGESLDRLQGYYEKLSPGSLNFVNEINNEVNDIQSLVDLIRVKFEGPEGYRHEKFADALLDGLAEEMSARLAAVAAMKCQMVPQETVEFYADLYYDLVQDRLDIIYNDENPNSIMYQLKNSDFYTWPETIESDISDSCSIGAPPGCYCQGNYRCTVTDGYRYDLVSETIEGCGSCENSCEASSGTIDACSKMIEDANNYATDTYDNIASKTAKGADLARMVQKQLELAAEDVAAEDCEPIMRGGRGVVRL